MAAGLVPVLAKLAIPLGVGLLFIAARKGRKEDEVTERAEDLTRRAVQAMQMANAQLLGMAANEFRAEDADPTTAGLLDFQKGRMVARGTRGFTTVPEWTDDKSLAVDNREVAVRLVQLEGRAKALDAWAQAYDTVGAKNLAKQLRTKAAALRGSTDPKDKAADKAADKKAADKKKADEKAKAKGEGAAKPDESDIVKQVADALASGSVEIMRKVAADLRSHGYTTQADSLDAAANEIEAELKAREDLRRRNEAEKNGKPEPEPTPVPKPVTHRKVQVTSKYNSESSLTKYLLGKADRWRELVAINVPTDADGKSRQVVTAALIKSKGVNPNRLGGLHPGLQPGQHLYIPDDWKLNSDDTKPVTPKPDTNVKPGGMGDALTTALITMLLGKSPGQEDTFLVKKWQTAQGRTADGKYGPGDASYMAETLKVVPPTPLYWPKSNTQKALTAWHQEMSRLSVERPAEANGYAFADAAAYQPGFEGMPSNVKIVSRRYNDNLGPTPKRGSGGSSGGSGGSTVNASTNATTTSRPTLRKGSNGKDVIYLQQRLGISPADGAFGPKTEAAVKAFQTSNHLVSDGIVGPKTWQAVESFA